MNSKFIESFQNPEAKYRGQPFWSWNGELDKDELLRQVNIMKEMGLGGYFMHSRTGLITEYLSDEWFDLINACADEGEKIGMESWLYDEDRWPSGTVGGIVTKNPKYRMKFIEMKVLDGKDFTWDEEMIAAFAVNLDEPNFTHKTRLTKENYKNEISSKTVLKFVITQMNKSSFYNGYTYVDTLNKEATELFIKLTHEKYKEKCGDRLGKSIYGVFTDEPNRGPVMNGFSIDFENKEYFTPWTYSLFGDFEKRFGYDLIDNLPELFLKKDSQDFSKVKFDYVEIVETLFIENFAIPCQKWCEDNNLILTGHILHEDNLTSQVALSGSMMRYYEYMTYPGIDILGERNMSFWVAKQVQSSKRQTGKKWVLSELYGGTGWQMDFEDHKEVGDWQALFGVNLRCHHLSWYTMEGEAKRDYPASILHQSYWYKYYSYVEDYFSRIHVFLEKGKPECDLLVIHPVETLWAQVYAGWSDQINLQDEKMRQTEIRFVETFNMLSGNKIDFDYGDEGVMEHAYKISIEDNKCYLHVGEMKYDKVLVSGLGTMRDSTIDILSQFIDKGGKVVFAGEVPANVNGEKSDKAIKLSKRASVVDFNEADLLSAIDKTDRKVKVTDENGNNIYSVFCQTRKEGQDTYIMLLNVDRDNDYPDTHIELNYSGYLNVADVRKGEIKTVSEYKDSHEINLNLYKSMEVLYIISKEPKGEVQDTKERELIKKIKLDQKYKYKLTEENICVLDFVNLKVDGRDVEGEFEVLKADKKVRDIFNVPHRAGDMVQPWFSKLEGHDKLLGQVSLEYEFYIESVKKDITLVVERPEIFDIKVNGKTLKKQSSYEKWVDICFNKLNIPFEYIKKGRNTFTLSADFKENNNIEAIYLLGEFGVRLEDENKKILVDLPEKLSLDNIEKQLLPFYGASIVFDIPLDIKDGNTASFYVDDYSMACINVNDKTLAFKPYEMEFEGDLKLELVFTRRNTFGPLHQIPMFAPGYGPDNYVTEGEAFTNSYSIIPSGLNSGAYINIYKK